MDEKYLHPFHQSPTTSTASSTENLSLSPAPPAAIHSNEKANHLEPPHHDFDPCENAKPCSPFYNHDTPRSSADQRRLSSSLHLVGQDLEAQNDLSTPQERVGGDSRWGSGDSNRNSNTNTLRPWPSRIGISARKNKKKMPKPMTQPKRRSCSCMSKLSKRQRWMVKIFIVLVIIGIIVGIGVGISLRVGGEVYKDDSTTQKIGET